MKNITELALKNSRVTIFVFLAIICFGIVGFFGLARDSMPPYTVRQALVVTEFPGADPLRVESLVTSKLEEAIQEVPEIKSITSISRTGLSVITVELKMFVKKGDLQAVWDKLRRKLDVAAFNLPLGVSPFLKDDDVGVTFGIILGLVNEGVPPDILKNYADKIRQDIIKLPDAAKVILGGIQSKQIVVEFDDAVLARYGLTADKLFQIINLTNIVSPGGEINIAKKRIILEISGNYKKIRDLKRTVIPTKTGQIIFLGDIVNIFEDYKYPPDSIVAVNGKPAISFYISLIDGANVIRLGKDIDRTIKEVNSKLPLGMNLVRLASQDVDVEKQVSDFMSNLYQSVIVVLAVMILFLGLKVGIVVAVLIPLTIITTLFFMNIFSLGLNKVSLAAMIMALGLLVDNGIVMVESIMLRVEKGESVFDASINASRILFVPLLISSLTTSAAFLSFFLSQSNMGEIVAPLFSVITISLLSSLIISFTILPLFAILLIKATTIKAKQKKKSYMSILNNWYNKILLKTLRKPMFFIFLTIILFILSLYGMMTLPFQLVPDSDRNLVTVDINFPAGTKIEVTEKAVRKIENYIKDKLLINDNNLPGIIDYSSYIGSGPESYDLGYFRDEPNSSYAHMLLNTSSAKYNDYIVSVIDKFCWNNIPQADIRVKRLSGAGAAGTPVEIHISGYSPEKLYMIAQTVKSQLLNIKGSKNINDNWGSRIKKININIDQAKLMRTGLTNQDVATALDAGLSGLVVGDFRKTDQSIPIVLKNENNKKKTLGALKNFNIYSYVNDRKIPLSQIADISPSWQFSKIARRELMRTISIGTYLDQGITAGDIFNEILPWLEQQKEAAWPKGYYFELGGEEEKANESLNSVFIYLPISLFLIVLLLIMQFNSFRKTAIIFLSIPLALIGVVFGWIITDSFMSFFGILGIISLAGIVVNASIILIDSIEVEKEKNPEISNQDAIINAANNKFRPVLMTTATTSLGMLPLWFGGGELWKPLAVAIIFGLLVSTAIILLFVPICYKILYRVKF